METKNNGITLIALIITIIVLLILAGVTIATLTGNHGILTQVDEAKVSTIKSKVEEEIGLAVQSANLKIRTKTATDNSWNAVIEGILPTTAIAKTATSNITNEGVNGAILVTLLADLQKKGYYVEVEAVEGDGTEATRKITITYEGSDYRKAKKDNNAIISKTLNVNRNTIKYVCINHKWVEEIISGATCEGAGSKKQTCTECGETKIISIAKLEHTWDEGVETTVANCTEAGIKTITCTVCEKTKEEEIQALGHNFVDGVCTRCLATFSGNLTELGITWAILEDIAKQVSRDTSIRAETTETSSYNIVTSVTKTVGDKTYTISLGDWMPVEYGDGSSKITKKARIIGFKHDELASNAAYGGTTDTYAGISFEFVNTLGSSGMNNNNTNEGGWEGCALRAKLLPTTGEYYAKLPSELTAKIKTVKKKCNPGGGVNEAGKIKVTEDKLWLLSWTEVYGGKVGNCDPEGVRYGNYTKDPSDENRKKYSGASTSSTFSSWWFRTPHEHANNSFWRFSPGGSAYDILAMAKHGVAPGFSI